MEETPEIVLGSAKLGEAYLGSDIFYFGLGLVGVTILWLSIHYFVDRFNRK